MTGVYTVSLLNHYVICLYIFHW